MTKFFKGPNGFIFGVDTTEGEKLAKQNGCVEVSGAEGDETPPPPTQTPEEGKLPVALGNSNLKEGFPGRDALFSAGLKNHRLVHQASDEQLLGIPGVSQETVTEIRSALSALIAQESK